MIQICEFVVWVDGPISLPPKDSLVKFADHIDSLVLQECPVTNMTASFGYRFLAGPCIYLVWPLFGILTCGVDSFKVPLAIGCFAFLLKSHQVIFCERPICAYILEGSRFNHISYDVREYSSDYYPNMFVYVFVAACNMAFFSPRSLGWACAIFAVGMTLILQAYSEYVLSDESQFGSVWCFFNFGFSLIFLAHYGNGKYLKILA